MRKLAENLPLLICAVMFVVCLFTGHPGFAIFFCVCIAMVL